MVLYRCHLPHPRPLFSVFTTDNLHKDIFPTLLLGNEPRGHGGLSRGEGENRMVFLLDKPTSELTYEHLSAKLCFISEEYKLSAFCRAFAVKTCMQASQNVNCYQTEDQGEKEKRQFLSSSPIPQTDPYLKPFIFYGYCIWDFLQCEDK